MWIRISTWWCWWLVFCIMPFLAQSILFGDIYHHFVNSSFTPKNISEFKITVPPLMKWRRPTTVVTIPKAEFLDELKRKMRKGGATDPPAAADVTTNSGTNVTTAMTPTVFENATIMVEGLDLLPEPRTYRMYYDELADEVRSLSSQLYGAFADKSFSVNCRAHSSYLISNASHDNDQAIKMIDAMAKLPSAALTGNLFWSGSYMECVQSAVNLNDTDVDALSLKPFDNVSAGFTGQYCIAEIKREGRLASALHEMSPPVTTFVMREAKLKLGVCVPSTCSHHEIEKAVKMIVTDRHDLDVTVDEDYCQNKLYPSYVDHRFVIIVTFLCAWSIFIILGTLLDLTSRSCSKPSTEVVKVTNVDPNLRTKSPDSSVEKHLQTTKEYVRKKCENWKHGRTTPIMAEALTNFSLISNLERLVRVDTSGDYMGYLDGIRVLSMGWIVLGHVYSVSFPYMWDNIEDVSKTRQNITFHMVVNGLYAVDTFFFVTGYLATIRTLQKLEDRDLKEGRHKHASNKLNVKFVLGCYAGRYLRLTPNYAITILLMSLLGPYLSYGPLWPAIEKQARNCGMNWWTNLLYISNFVNMNTMCQPHCWYLAVDMQIWIVAAILILLLHRRQTYGIFVISGFICASLLVTAILIGIRRYPSSPVLHRGTLEVLNSYYQQVYIKPYCRLTPFFVGILVGNYIHAKQTSEDMASLATTNSRLVRWSCIFGAAAVCFAQGFFVHLPESTPIKFYEAGPAVYGPFTKLMWSAVMGLFVIELEASKKSYVNLFLSARIFTPLLRLTYWAFLLHYGLLLIFFKSRQEPTQFDHWTMTNIFLGLTTLTYLAALLCFLYFELPVRLCARQLRRAGRPLSSSQPLISNNVGIEEDAGDVAVAELPPTPTSSETANKSDESEADRRDSEYWSAPPEGTKGLLTVEVHHSPDARETRVSPEGTSKPESPTHPESPEPLDNTVYQSLQSTEDSHNLDGSRDFRTPTPVRAASPLNAPNRKLPKNSA